MLHENKVTVKKSELLEKLKTNLQTHVHEYEDALRGYHEAVVEALEQMLATVRAKGVSEYKTHALMLDAPESHESDYKRAIAMLEMSVSDEVTLSVGQFAHYVLDEWQWRDHFVSSTMSYRSKK